MGIPHLTALGGIPVPKDQKVTFEIKTAAELMQKAVDQWRQKDDSSRGLADLEFKEVQTNDGNAWSQDVYIVLKDETAMYSMNNKLADAFKDYGKESGFGGPSGKPHMSLMYGNHSPTEKEGATALINQAAES